MKKAVLLLTAMVLVGVGVFSPFALTPATPDVRVAIVHPRPKVQPCGDTSQMDPPRGLVAQESGAAVAAQYGVAMAAKGWPANRGWSAIDQELVTAERLGIQLMVGLMWQNETYTGAPSALPTHWDSVCWGGTFAGCGPNYANPVTRGQALQLIREFATRYDGHPQIAGTMAAIGDDRERRFCKDPQPGSACRVAYDAAGLTPAIWKQWVADVIRTFEEAFKITPVLVHYSGFGFYNWEVDRDARVAADAGLGLMSSGLYPQNCPGHYWSCPGGVPPSRPLTDWQVPGAFPDSFAAMEQSLGYTGDQAALAWLNAICHGAEQIHAQRQTMANSVGTEWRETAEYMLANPAAAIWVARDADATPCKASYCPEQGNWSRNVIEATYGELGLDVAPGYMGLVARRAPVRLTTGIVGSVQITVVLANGDRLTWQQGTGEVVLVNVAEYVHRIEVRPMEPIPIPSTPTLTPTGTWAPASATPTRTATQQPQATATATRTLLPSYTPTSTPTVTQEPTSTATPVPTGPPTGWTVKGRFGVLGIIDLVFRPFWE